MKIQFALLLPLLTAIAVNAQNKDTIRWSAPIVINNVRAFTDSGAVPEAGPSGLRKHGEYGSQYCRLLLLRDGSWLAGYTVSRCDGYDRSKPYGPASTGGLELEISKSTDKGKTWQIISTISEPGRDLDNTQMIETKNGAVLLACRSVRWQESYILRTYKSNDKGRHWEKFSVFDSTAGAPGALGKPDKGIYEPHFYYLNDGRLAVQYANEKHVVENPSYSQIISEKISSDEGRTWGPEIWVAYEPGHPDSRPGMPVWTKMTTGEYITVYEICGPEKCGVYYKKSADGEHWPIGLGTPIPDQMGGPFILGLKDGRFPLAFFGSGVNSSADASLDVININDRWLENGSYIRLRNIELAYQLPAKAIRPLHVQSARCYISGQNLLTITKYKGLDPEVANGDIFSRGVDYESYPTNRLLAAGVQLGF